MDLLRDPEALAAMGEDMKADVASKIERCVSLPFLSSSFGLAGWRGCWSWLAGWVMLTLVLSPAGMSNRLQSGLASLLQTIGGGLFGGGAAAEGGKSS